MPVRVCVRAMLGEVMPKLAKAPAAVVEFVPPFEMGRVLVMSDALWVCGPGVLVTVAVAGVRPEIKFPSLCK